MIRKYIEPPTTMILVISEANIDDERCKALSLAKEFDPDGKRTMRVLAKFDNFSDEGSRDSAIASIKNSKDDILGAHAVIARPDGKLYDKEMEAAKLGKYTFPKERSGIPAVTSRLMEALCDLVLTNVPHLREKISEKRDAALQVLREIGEEAPQATAIMQQLEKKLSAAHKLVSKESSALLKDFQGSVHATKKKIGKDEVPKWIEEAFAYDAYECIFFQGSDAFANCVSQTAGWWFPLIKNLHQEMDKLLRSLCNDASAINVDEQALNAIKRLWEEKASELSQCLWHELQRELEKEKRFKTMNHYLTSKFRESLVLPETVLDKFVVDATDCVEKYRGFKTVSSDNIALQIKKLLENAVVAHSAAFEKKTLEEQQLERIVAAVKANWAVSHKNFIDNVHDCVNRCMNDGVKNWLGLFMTLEPVRKFASEPRAVEEKRSKAKKQRISMNECIEELDKWSGSVRN